MQLRWFDYFLKGIDNGAADEAPIRLFVMGDNRWRDENEWPLARTRYTKLYLHSDGKANSLGGDGGLSASVPNEEPQDHYVYDPHDPVPTRGGTTLGMAMGVLDQTKIEKRQGRAGVHRGDAEPGYRSHRSDFPQPLRGVPRRPTPTLPPSSSTLRPDGYAQNIAEGVIRARFRESHTTPSLITPGEVYAYTIDLWATSHVFKAGHRFRLEVSSSNFPRYDRNPNTGHDFGVDSALQTAQQTIFHDSRYPSHLVLPVISALGGERARRPA